MNMNENTQGKVNDATRLTGWAAMDKYVPDWQGHNYPAWLPKIARDYHKKIGSPVHYYRLGNFQTVIELFNRPEWLGLFDHWGRRGPAAKRILTTMPYWDERKKALLFAKRLGLDLISPAGAVGAWAPGTSLFEFALPDPPRLRVLRLTLKRKWFDMIASGEKKEEYRTPGRWISSRVNGSKTYDLVEFKNGYGPTAPVCHVEYRGFVYRSGKPQWGADPFETYLVILLGKVISKPALPGK